jgi:hypothetical protein
MNATLAAKLTLELTAYSSLALDKSIVSNKFDMTSLIINGQKTNLVDAEVLTKLSELFYNSTFVVKH